MNATEMRFWAKVDTSGECWTWTASKRSKGYGAFVYPGGGGEVVHGRAHRFSWELRFGPIPDGLCVLHHCDNPACVRPEHLFLGTRADNNRDMHSKGRAVRGGTYGGCRYPLGEKHHNCKITDREVDRLRSDREGGLSYSKLARKYGISQTHAFRIVNHLRRAGS